MKKNFLKFFLLILLMSALASCSQSQFKPAAYPVPAPPKMETVRVLRCIPASEFESPEQLISAARAGASGDPLCFPKSSQWRFVTFREVLVNDRRQRHYIQTLLSNPNIQILP